MKNKLLILTTLFILIFVLILCSAGNSVSGTVQEGKLIVGFDANFPPMGFEGDDGNYTGFDINLATEVAANLNLELVLQPIAWDSKDMELQTKSIDCIWNGFTINGREDEYTWSKPYMVNNQVFVVRSGSNIKSFDDLAGKVIMAQVDSSADTVLKEKTELLDTFGDYLLTPDYNNAFMELESSSIDAIAMDDVAAKYQIQQRGDGFLILEEILSSEEYGIGFLKGNEVIRDEIQKALDDLAADGTMSSISEKWFGSDITAIEKQN